MDGSLPNSIPVNGCICLIIIIKILAILGVALFILITWSMCAVAGRADEQAEEIERKRKDQQ